MTFKERLDDADRGQRVTRFIEAIESFIDAKIVYSRLGFERSARDVDETREYLYNKLRELLT